MKAVILAAAITSLASGAFSIALGASDPNPNGAQTEFDVTQHGFDFVNNFSGDILIDLPLIGQVNFGGTSYGLCGGMSFAALDNFNLDCKAPDGLGQPVSGSEMQSYLYSRLDDSFRYEDAFLIRRLIEWTPRPIETKAGVTGLHVLSDRQFKRIIAPAIDAGYPVPLCIIKAEVGDDVSTNYQVLAIGYRLCPETTTLKRHWGIDIYDPNVPDKVCTLHYSDSGRGLTLKHAGGTSTSLNAPVGTLNVDLSKDKYSGLRGFFVVPYDRRTPYWCTASAGRPIKGGAIVVKEDPIGDTPEGNTPAVELPDVRLPGTLGDRRSQPTVASMPSAQQKTSRPVNGLGTMTPSQLKGVHSPDAENEDNSPDPKGSPDAGKLAAPDFGSAPITAGVRIKDHPKADAIMNAIARELGRRDINIALLGQRKYMVADCLGLKVSAGEFSMRLANPSFRFENLAAVLEFRVERVSMTALSVRMRPNPTNVLEPCTFSRRFELGGSASDLRLELRFDPLLDLERCRVGNRFRVHCLVRIGGLNLQPLQNDLDPLAKNMIEDAITYYMQYYVDANTGGSMQELKVVNQITQTIDDILEADCPFKPGDAGEGGQEILEDVLANGAGIGDAAGKLRSVLEQIEALEQLLSDATSEGGILAALPADAMQRLDEIRPLLERLSKLDAQISSATVALSKIASNGGKPSGPNIADDKPLPGAPCCELTANPELKGRLGRVVVKFPEGSKTGDRTHLYKAGDTKAALTHGDGGMTTDAIPGQYAIVINGLRIEGVEVRAGHDTNVRVGVLRILSASGTARLHLYEPGGKGPLSHTDGPYDFGLLPGKYEVELLGQREVVIIKSGVITEF